MCLASFTYHNVFKGHPHCSMHQYAIPFNGWIILYCVYILYLFIHSSVDGYLGCFYLLDIINNAAKNIQVQVFVWTYVFISVGLYTYCWVIMVTLCLMVWVPAKLFPKAVAPFCISTSRVWSFQFLHSLNTCYCLFLNTAILVGMKWYSAMILICISVVANAIENVFIC